MDFKQQNLDFERLADTFTAVSTAPVGLWMILVGNVVAALGMFCFSVIAIVRLTSTGVRRWTDEHQWLFFVILAFIVILTIVDAMP